MSRALSVLFLASTSADLPTSVIRSPSMTTAPSNTTSPASFMVMTLPFLMMIRSLIGVPLCLTAYTLPGLRHSRLQVEPDGLGLQVWFQRLLAKFAAETGLL